MSAQSKIPRLELEQFDSGVAAMLAPRVKRLGYLGEFFKTMGHQPAALKAFMEFTEALKQALPPKITEVVALTVATATGNDYERHQHERLSDKLGFGRQWIEAVIALDDGAALTGEETAVQRLVLAMLDSHGHDVRPKLAQVVETLGPERTVAVLLLIGRYVAHALIVNALELAPPVPSIFAKAEA